MFETPNSSKSVHTGLGQWPRFGVQPSGCSDTLKRELQTSPVCQCCVFRFSDRFPGSHNFGGATYKMVFLGRLFPKRIDFMVCVAQGGQMSFLVIFVSVEV